MLTKVLASKSMAESNNNNLIGFIASTVEKLRDDVVTMREQMSTKEDLARLEGRFTERLDPSIVDMATKQDLARLEGRVTERLDASITVVRGDLEQIQLRLDSIEHGMSSKFEHVEGELSRLRSAVYLLGKDRPEVLRLLGQNSL
jgi:hypothetical protein